MVSLLDSANQAWQVTISNTGRYGTTAIPGLAPSFVLINDTFTAATWQLVVDTNGQLNITATFTQSAPTQLPLTAPSGAIWQLQITSGRFTFVLTNLPFNPTPIGTRPVAPPITLQRTVDYVRRFIRLAPLTFSGTNDPALMMADWVRGFMLSPPYAWRWNRGAATFQTTAGTQDYTLNLQNFGWLEQASITDTSTSPENTYQLEISLNQETETIQTQPTKICAQSDDGNGNVSLRFIGNPDLPYICNFSYQLSAPTFVSLNDTWSPIPAYMDFAVQTGMLAKAYEYIGDERFAATIQMFVRQVAAFSGGLVDSQLNIFLQDKVNSQITGQSQTSASESGQRGRALS